MAYEANRRVETSARTFAIVEQLARRDSAGISDLAATLEMNKGIVHNHVSTLRELGYVRKVDDQYQLSPKFLTTGYRARSNTRLYEYASASVQAFTDELSLGVVLIQPSERDCAVVAAHGVPPSVELAVGSQFDLTDSLAGLVVLAGDGRENLDNVSPERYDTARITASVDQHGYALGPLAASAPVESVAVPILDSNDHCHGSVGVLFPDDDHSQEREAIVDATVSLRTRIEARFRSEWAGERSFATEKHSWTG